MQAGARLTKVAVPLDGRVAILDPSAMVGLVQDTMTLFNPSAAISEQYRTGQPSMRASASMVAHCGHAVELAPIVSSS